MLYEYILMVIFPYQTSWS